MSDFKTLNLSSLVSKKTRRAKTRLMQNFGKADKTTDELFEAHQLSFNRQQNVALNFQKQFKHYVHCIKELHLASKALNTCVIEMHEKEWPKHDSFENNSYELEQINEDLEDKLQESVLVPLEQYLGQFAEMREKIAKRGRKLVDYDSQRHSFETLKQIKQYDEAKLSEHKEQLEEARRVYETLNQELHEELPELYDNRLPFVVTVFQRLFSSHITYHDDSVAVHKGYLESVELLAKAIERGTLNYIYPILDQQLIGNNQVSSTTGGQNEVRPPPPQPDGGSNADATSQAQLQSQAEDTQANATGATSTGLSDLTSPPSKPHVLLHKVKTTYRYPAEDEDELSFDAGEIIQVIEYDDPAEQEEGWLMGIKESDGTRGLFPANFAKELKNCENCSVK